MASTTSPQLVSDATGVAGLVPAAVAATRAAALACEPWVGRGDRRAADAAATEAMRAALADAPGTGTVVIGEGEKDDAPMLFNGERVGDGDGPRFDIAVDPLEGTSLCAHGRPGAMATIAFAEHGALWDPGPAFYMDKLIVGPAARHAIDLNRSPEDNVWHVARALGKPMSKLTAVVLDKPRHEGLVKRVRSTGATVLTPTDGDVGGSLQALLPGGGADILLGVGGTPEGVLSACAVLALGGGMQARIAPQRPDEARALQEERVDTRRTLGLRDLVHGACCFVATGVTAGPLLRAPARSSGRLQVETLIITEDGVRKVLS